MKAPSKQSEHKRCGTCDGTGFVFFERGEWSYVGRDGITRTGTHRWAERCPMLTGQQPEDVPF